MGSPPCHRRRTHRFPNAPGRAMPSRERSGGSADFHGAGDACGIPDDSAASGSKVSVYGTSMARLSCRAFRVSATSLPLRRSGDEPDVYGVRVARLTFMARFTTLWAAPSSNLHAYPQFAEIPLMRKRHLECHKRHPRHHKRQTRRSNAIKGSLATRTPRTRTPAPPAMEASPGLTGTAGAPAPQNAARSRAAFCDI